ncbi:MAG: TolC family protein [Bacteroidota bacterium]
MTQEVRLAGEPTILEFPVNTPNYQKNPYFSQLGENFGQQVGLRIAYSIYDQKNRQLTRQQKELELLNSKLLYDHTHQKVNAQWLQMKLELRSAFEQYQSQLRRVETSQLLYEQIEKKYGLGVSTLLEKNFSLLQLEQTRNKLIYSKYDYYFKLLIYQFTTTGILYL